MRCECGYESTSRVRLTTTSVHRALRDSGKSDEIVFGMMRARAI
jgi:hypothetical protein